MPDRDVPITKRVAYFAGCFARFHDPKGSRGDSEGSRGERHRGRGAGAALLRKSRHPHGRRAPIVADARRNLRFAAARRQRFTVVASAPSCAWPSSRTIRAFWHGGRRGILAAHTIDTPVSLEAPRARELRTDFKECRSRSCITTRVTPWRRESRRKPISSEAGSGRGRSSHRRLVCASRAPTV